MNLIFAWLLLFIVISMAIIFFSEVGRAEPKMAEEAIAPDGYNEAEDDDCQPPFDGLMPHCHG